MPSPSTDVVSVPSGSPEQSAFGYSVHVIEPDPWKVPDSVALSLYVSPTEPESGSCTVVIDGVVGIEVTDSLSPLSTAPLFSESPE